MRNFTNWPQQAGQLLSKPMSIEKVVLHTSDKGMLTSIIMYAKCDKNIPCGSRVMNISLTVW